MRYSVARRSAGFTLIETMVTVAVTAILLTIAVAGFTDILRRNSLESAAHEFTTALHLAKSSAIKHNSNRIRMGAIANAGTSNEWGAGWRVWQDVGANNNTYDNGDTLILEEKRDDTTTINSLENSAVIAFGSTGQITQPDFGTFIFCDSREGEQGHEIRIFKSGQISLDGKIQIAANECQ